MIIDLTGNVCLKEPVSTEVAEWQIDYEARDEWHEFKKTRVDNVGQISRSAAIVIVKAALRDDHMRGILVKASPCSLRPRIQEIVSNFELVKSFTSNPFEHDVDLAAIEIVDMDFALAKKRKKGEGIT